MLEDLVLQVRQELRDTSDLGEFGAAVIRAELVARDVVGVPSVRTVGRILERRGVLDARRRVRRPPPPRGWYLPAVARGDAELDSVDITSAPCAATPYGAGNRTSSLSSPRCPTPCRVVASMSDPHVVTHAPSASFK
ncbi:MAG TPA: hypothetical protein VLZ06_10100 [Solirubrobacteraceae bacterium]|nr:hypothetical protein [Solirubrobacteraceae bacterium]